MKKKISWSGSEVLELESQLEFDVIIAGAGVSGSYMAAALTARGKRCLVIEAGKYFEPGHYPRNELDANSQLYWSGGIEFNQSADLGLLRPKVVGGGSIVNQALIDRFDDLAWADWQAQSGVEFFSTEKMAQWYDEAERFVSIQTIPAEHRNGNARIFQEGFEKNGFRCAPLRRAQRDCRYADGNDCIECLAGCPLQSKQSTPWTSLKRAFDSGLMTLVPQSEVLHVREAAGEVRVRVRSDGGYVR